MASGNNTEPATKFSPDASGAKLLRRGMREYSAEELQDMDLSEIESLIDARECDEIDQEQQS